MNYSALYYRKAKGRKLHWLMAGGLDMNKASRCANGFDVATKTKFVYVLVTDDAAIEFTKLPRDHAVSREIASLEAGGWVHLGGAR